MVYEKLTVVYDDDAGKVFVPLPTGESLTFDVADGQVKVTLEPSREPLAADDPRYGG